MKQPKDLIKKAVGKAFNAIIVLLLFKAGDVYGQGRKVISFDSDWKFIQEDVSGAEKPEFNDSKWRSLHVPHDWSIEGNYSRSNTTGRGGGYLPAGIGWYRKSFIIPDGDVKKQYFIEFDGIMANSDVWINGKHLGKRPFGYISFSYAISKYLKYGNGKNIVAVRADNSVQPASRYYAGAGIYRHVRLLSVNPVHFTQWGTFISTSEVKSDKATVDISSEVENTTGFSGEFTLKTILVNSEGMQVKSAESRQAIAAGATVSFQQTIAVNSPLLWSIEKPLLYKAVSTISQGNKVLDEQTTTFGIREVRFEAATGFWLNGKNVKIKGVCLHHDGGAVGAAVPLGVWEQRLQQLKEVGVNGIRTGHNPMAPEFLDLCDRMGFVVLNETFDTWTAAKNNGEKGYNLFFKEWWERDTKDMVMRDRNHPSVILYSIGNEIRDDLSYPEGYKRYKEQQDVVKRYDPTRMVTMALFRPGSSKVYTSGFAEQMEVVGQNYRETELVAAHEANPHWKVIGTENGHDLNQWLTLRDKPYMAGQFLWTGYDYLGESDWPQTTNGAGLFDRANNWKQSALQRQSWWSDKPVVHLVRRSDNAGSGAWVADWTPADFDTYDNASVEVYSNCTEVELFLNGKSLGVKAKPADDSPRQWDVTFEKGSIKAVGRNGGVEVASEEFKTASAPAKIVLTASKNKIYPGWNDVSFIQASIVDAEGNTCPNAYSEIKFTVTGPGTITAVDNGDIKSHETYKSDKRTAYMGKAVAIVKGKATGKVTIKAEGEGLAPGTVTVNVSP